MTNPFEALDITDDQQDQYITNNNPQKARKTHKERRQMKKIGQQEPPKLINQSLNTEVPVRVRDNAKQVRHNRQGRPPKGVPQGHPLDRRSGTGREDRPRKQGGGRGGIGNVHDQFNRDKYEKPTEQIVAVEEKPQEQKVPQEPQKLTLAEYYESKGISFNTTVQRKIPEKKQVNAEWLKKEKLTLVETKQDKKKQELLKQNVLQQKKIRNELGFEDSQILGFGSKPVQKHKEEQPQKNHSDKTYKGKKPQNKIAFREDDFPTL